MSGRFSVEAVFKAVDRITAPVSRMQNRVGKFTRSTERRFRNLNKTVGKFASGLKRGAVTTAAALTVMAVAMTSVVATGAEFEQAITNVGAVSLKTRADIEPLEQMALKLGKTTKFTATQAANAMEVLARAGFKTQEILAATPAVLNAAAASGLEIAEVADHVSNALKGMGLESKEAARVADVLALASSKTNSSIGSLGESLSNVSSTARQLNVPLEDTVAAVALLQDVGLDASVAGSAMNTMLTKMAAPTTGITKKMKKFGITFKDAKGNMLPFQKVIGQLSIASKKAGGNFDKVAFLAELVGLRGQKAAANLADLFETGKLEKLVKELENAEGAAKKMADIRMNTVQGSMLLLGSAVDAVKVKIFTMNEGPLKGLIDRITAWVSLNDELIASNIGGFLGSLIDNFSNIVTWLKHIGTAIAVFATFAIILKSFIAIMTAVNIVMAMNPLGLTILSIVAVGAALAALVALIYVKWEPIKEFFAGLWDTALLGFNFFIDSVLGAFSTLKGVLSGVGSTLKSVGGFFGFGDDDEESDKAGGGSQVISPQDRVARSIEEKRQTSTAEVTIKDDTGRAAVTGGKLGPGLKLQSSGAF